VNTGECMRVRANLTKPFQEHGSYCTQNSKRKDMHYIYIFFVFHILHNENKAYF